MPRVEHPPSRTTPDAPRSKDHCGRGHSPAPCEPAGRPQAYRAVAGDEDHAQDEVEDHAIHGPGRRGHVELTCQRRHQALVSGGSVVSAVAIR